MFTDYPKFYANAQREFRKTFNELKSSMSDTVKTINYYVSPASVNGEIAHVTWTTREGHFPVHSYKELPHDTVHTTDVATGYTVLM